MGDDRGCNGRSDFLVRSRSQQKLGDVGRNDLVALLTFLIVQVGASPTQLVVVQDGTLSGPRVVLSIDPKTSQRYVQLIGQRMPVYPTADITCDWKRRTIPLTRSERAGDRIVAIYVGASGRVRMDAPGRRVSPAPPWARRLPSPAISYRQRGPAHPRAQRPRK